MDGQNVMTADLGDHNEVRATAGTCPTCLEHVPASVLVRGGDVVLEKRCPEHGNQAQRLSRHPELWRELDETYFKLNSATYRQRDFIVRMTERCNLSCPICLARANTADTPDFDLARLEELLSTRRGIKIDLMAAEPTLRKDLEHWVRRVKATGNIAALHTNGLRLADFDYARRLKEAGVDEVFLQFDGFDDDANQALRGRALRDVRLQVLENLRQVNLATSLIVVIAGGLNEGEVERVLRFALQPAQDHIREVFFMGLRLLGSANDASRHADSAMAAQQLMPDDLIDLLCAQAPEISRADVHAFNLFYFALLSLFQVKKCLYIQHYLMLRTPDGKGQPIGALLDMKALGDAARRYANARDKRRATVSLLATLARQGLRPGVLRAAGDLLALERLFRDGMNLGQVPRRLLLLGFITACDPYNFDAQVAINCGKGELSVDGGYHESSAVANVERESRMIFGNKSQS